MPQVALVLTLVIWGLKVNLFGDDKGSVTEIPAGRYVDMSPNITYYKFPLFVQTYKWTEGKDEGSENDEAIRFQTSEGLQITADIGVTFMINGEAGTAKALFLKYRRGVEEIIDSPLRNAVRDSFNKFGAQYTADQVISTGKTELISKVEADVRAQFAPNIQVTNISWLSSPRPPESIIKALNAKVEATQLATQRENEVRTAEAEALKKVAEAKGTADSILLEARSQAEANRLLSQSITPQIIELKRIEKWDGKYPTVTGGNAVVDMRSIVK